MMHDFPGNIWSGIYHVRGFGFRGVVPGGQYPLKYTVTHYRKPEHRHEAPIKRPVEEHPPPAIPIFKKHGVLAYSLFITPASLNGAPKQEMEKTRPTWDVADYDRIIEYTLSDMQVIPKVVSDPDWRAAIANEKADVDTKKALLSVGYSPPYLLEIGEAVNLST
ncbi:hypothetical protein RRF57_007840 [Xylaria bambusicola]|uniref:EthD domain-containing protein n=1 Tax=Xylaria bambusicola TaxID=326684 RepID=A0AAN7UUB2_9PEZI